jgi:hypothetical protein
VSGLRGRASRLLASRRRAGKPRRRAKPHDNPSRHSRSTDNGLKAEVKLDCKMDLAVSDMEVRCKRAISNSGFLVTKPGVSPKLDASSHTPTCSHDKCQNVLLHSLRYATKKVSMIDRYDRSSYVEQYMLYGRTEAVASSAVSRLTGSRDAD